jgi:PAS domain S-box-containing protein
LNNGPQGAARSHRPEAETVGAPQAAILMVDDHPANLVALEATLAPLGQRLVCASSGREALKALLVDEFAAILLDVQMPGLDGFETAALIRAHPRTAQVPIIFVTAIHRDAPHVARGYEYRCVDYMAKPFDPGILRSKVSVLVDIFLREKRIEAQAAALRQREREELRRSGELRMQRLIDSVPVSIWALRADGTFYDCNRAWTEYAGVKSVADVRVDPAVLVHPDDLPRLRQAWASAFARGEPLDAQCRVRRATDGTFRWHVGRAVPERDDTGAVIGWIVTGADIENQKRAEDEYARVVERERQAREEAEAANRAKDEFLATLSHELRTPLAAMVGWTGMLRSGNLSPEKSRKALETIERNAKAQAVLIEDILDVSRIITGKLRLETQPIELGTIARAAVEAVRPSAEAKGIQLETSIAALPAGFRGDPSRLQQVIWNLLSNAIKFTSAGGHVSLSVDELGASAGAGRPGDARIVVRDDGRGIAANFVPFIFDRFRQVDSTSKRAHGGLGLGLAIVRHLVELHGGAIGVESAGEGRGATFTVTLPRAEKSNGEMAPDAEPIAAIAARLRSTVSMPGGAPSASAAVTDGISLTGIRVLLVDDEADARELLAEVLEQYGAAVTAVASADDAVRVLREERPTVLLSDIGLPGEDGHSLMRRVRALPPEAGGRTPAAALTAFARTEDGRRSLAAGFHRHATKPIQPAALALLVRELADLAAATPPSARS